MADHVWVPSPLGHGESMCKYCFVTNREAAVLGILGEECDAQVKEKDEEESK